MSRLHGIADIRRHFLTSDQRWFFVSATNFNLLEMDTWVSSWRCVNFIDCFDGRHPRVYVPPPTAHGSFTCLEDVVNHLLEHKQVIDWIGAGGGKAVFLMFDDRTEELCRALGLDVAFPAAALRREVNDKVSATRIADRAGVASVPNVLAPVDSYQALRAAARHLGPDLVVQTSFGDSGHTTFFISTEEDFRKHAAEIRGEREVKIMRRIRCAGAAMEGCVTRHGTLVAPIMTEIVGVPELTPYKGGWCGNELVVGAFPDEVDARARRAAFTLGEELRRMGYRGYFELDFLVDLDDGQVYLGEINPRITGASSLTNLSAFAHADAPLFLFHLCEWSGIDYDIDVAALNERFADRAGIDGWSQIVIKHTSTDEDVVVQAPLTGVWRMRSVEDASIELLRPATDRRAVSGEDEAFWLRISGEGDVRYEGADLGILLVRGRLLDSGNRLTPRARAWIRALRGRYSGRPLVSPEAPAPTPVKLGRFRDPVTTRLVFRAVSSPEPSDRMGQLFAEAWPAYRRWFFAEGHHVPPTFFRAREALREHMPELVPTWERLVEACGGGDLEARFLSLYCPAPFAVACSQAACTTGEPVLIRNYDYRPSLCDGVLLGSAWTGRRVLAMTDCLWGALDGMNEDGLCVSLTFGGRQEVGQGFGVPLVLRYILETASTTPEATAILRRVPVHMSHNVTTLDVAGRRATVYLAPGRKAEVSRLAYATNHQGRVAWPAHADATATVAREAHLAVRMADAATTAEALVDDFLSPPLHRALDQGWGTLYTAVYRPARAEMELRWRDRRWGHSLAAEPQGEMTISYR